MSAGRELAMSALAGKLDAAALGRRALWGLLAAKVVGGWGLGWDIRWHLMIGRDSFWIPPHVMTYAAVAAAAVLSLGVLVLETLAARNGARRPGTLSLAGLVGTRGFHLAWWGTALTIVAAPIDDLWHRLFGIDVTLWSPPHLMGLLGAQVNTLACLVIALELWPTGSRARTVALALGATVFLGTFQIVLDPSWRIAFLHGSVLFYTWGILGSLVLAFTLVLVTRLCDWRSLPLVSVVGAIIVQLTIFVVADVGFALTQPVSAIQGAIAADPTSPIAIAHEIARRSGGTPGRSLMSRLFPLVPAVLLVAIDARRRRTAATLAFGATLFVIAGVFAWRSPAFSHVVPALPETALAAVLALVGALAGGWLGDRLAIGLRPSPRPA